MTTAVLNFSQGTIRRLTGTLFAAQSLASLGMTSSFTVGAIAGAQLSGSPALAGLPTTLYLLGAALGAYPTGRVMDRYGRRTGLVLGFIIGLVGAGLGSVAILGVLPFVLFLAHGLMGLSRGALDQGRFAAADMVSSIHRARQVSWVVLGGTVGGIGGPLVLGPASRLAGQFGIEPLAGPYLAAVGLFVVGSAMIFLLLRPDPMEIGRHIAHEEIARQVIQLPARTFRQVLEVPAAQVAVASMVLAQVVMMTVMVMTPLEMTQHLHQTLDNVAIVIAAHVTGMYVTSLVSGRLADRVGHGRSILFGALLLILSCLLAPFAVEEWRLAAALFVLGAGWNFCYVAGSSLLTDTLRASERGRIQGANDLLVGIVTAIASLGSGVTFAAIGYGGMAAAGILLALSLFGVVVVMTRGRARLVGAV